MATQADASELAQVLGEISETVEVRAGKKAVKVTVTPFGLRQLAHVLKCVQRLRDAGVLDAKALQKVGEAADAKEAVKGFDMVKMFLEGGDEVINIIQVAVGRQLQAQELDGLNLVDGARLASAVFAVNLDFFYQNREAIQAALAPAVSAIEKVMQEGVEVLGQPPSTDS
ncbi:MAG TPA: hypothetical protein VF621_05070 [Pyrinomonadaceae bacterium]|jgi:hypothetical protein